MHFLINWYPLEAAKAQLAKAREAGDINAEVEAQALISEYGYKHAKLVETKAAQEELEKVTLLVEQAETKKEKIEATIELRKCKARLQAVA